VAGTTPQPAARGEDGLVATQPAQRLCSLEEAVGKHGACPEEACPFWEPGGAALGGRCTVEALGGVTDAALARWLLEIREQLPAERLGRV